MKGVANITLIFCVLVTITKGWILPLGVDHQTFSPKNLVSVRRVTRQVNEANCSLVQSKALCTSSFAQNYINAVSQCGSVGSAQAIRTEELCRQHSAGEYCISVDIHAVIINCCGSSVNCSTACRSNLTDFGCCLNPYRDILEQNFTACGLAFPSACPPSSLTIPTSSDNSFCSSRKDFISFSKKYFCSNGHPILDEFILNNCLKRARAYVDSCRYRGGKNCIDVIIATFKMQANAIMSCPLTSNCSANCSGALNVLNDNLGCCLNLLNASLRDIGDKFSAYSVITHNALWQQCGIAPPGVCESLLNAAAPSAYTTAAPSAYTTAAPSAYTTAAPAAYTTAAPSAYTTAAPSAYTTAAPSAYTTAAPSAYTTAAPSAYTTAAPSAYTTAESSLNAAAPSAYTTAESALDAATPSAYTTAAPSAYSTAESLLNPAALSTYTTAAPSAYTTAESSLNPAAPSAYTTAESLLNAVAPSAYTTAAPSAYTTAAPSAYTTAAPSAYTTTESSFNDAAPSAYTTAAPSAYTTAETLLNDADPSAYTTAGNGAAALSAYTTVGNIAFLILAASLFNFA